MTQPSAAGLACENYNSDSDTVHWLTGIDQECCGRFCRERRNFFKTPANRLDEIMKEKFCTVDGKPNWMQ